MALQLYSRPVEEQSTSVGYSCTPLNTALTSHLDYMPLTGVAHEPDRDLNWYTEILWRPCGNAN
jgi:hypothetical protein